MHVNVSPRSLEDQPSNSDNTTRAKKLTHLKLKLAAKHHMTHFERSCPDFHEYRAETRAPYYRLKRNKLNFHDVYNAF